jgi:hypothetical protein
MNSWYVVALPAEETGPGGKAMILQHGFEDTFIASGGPKDAAMFARRSDDFATHYFYFSPGAYLIVSKLLYAYSATPCPAPPKEGTRLCAGHSGVKDILLRDK